MTGPQDPRPAWIRRLVASKYARGFVIEAERRRFSKSRSDRIFYWAIAPLVLVLTAAVVALLIVALLMFLASRSR